MKKYGVHAFQVGEELTQLCHGTVDYRIIFVDKGILSITVQQERIQAISGDVLIVGSTGKKIRVSAEPDFSGFLLQINNSASANMVKRYLLLMNATERDINVFPTFDREQEIRKSFQSVMAEIQGEKEPNETILNLLAEELMVRLYRVTPKAPVNVHSNRAEIVSNIRTLLEKEFRYPFTLEMLSEKFNMSISYLSHIFKEITGVSVMRFLLEVRLQAARNYLSQTTLPINEVAEKCGFNDLSNFGRTFQKETGCSPRQYRSRHSTKSGKKQK